MRTVDHETQSREDWRAGVVTRVRASAVTGSVRPPRCDVLVRGLCR